MSASTDVSAVVRGYLALMTPQRNNRYAMSQYTVQKPWGLERWLELNQWYALKLIRMKPGKRCSLQYHREKVESNVVIRGDVTVIMAFPRGRGTVLKKRRFRAGEGWSVPAGVVHRVIAGPRGYSALECSSPQLDDVVRVADDTKRGSGKIGTEHHG